MAGVEERLINIETALNILGSRATSIEDSLLKHDSEISRLEKKLTDIEDTIGSISESISQINLKMEALSNENPESAEEFITEEFLNGKMEALESELYTLLNTYKDDVDKLREDYDNFVEDYENDSIDGDSVEVIDFNAGEIQ